MRLPGIFGVAAPDTVVNPMPKLNFAFSVIFILGSVTFTAYSAATGVEVSTYGTLPIARCEDFLATFTCTAQQISTTIDASQCACVMNPSSCGRRRAKDEGETTGEVEDEDDGKDYDPAQNEFASGGSATCTGFYLQSDRITAIGSAFGYISIGKAAFAAVYVVLAKAPKEQTVRERMKTAGRSVVAGATGTAAASV
jgi:hypothetical protein